MYNDDDYDNDDDDYDDDDDNNYNPKKLVTNKKKPEKKNFSINEHELLKSCQWNELNRIHNFFRKKNSIEFNSFYFNSNEWFCCCCSERNKVKYINII